MKIGEGVYAVREVKGIFVHAFLVDDGNDLTLVDTLYNTTAQTILDELDSIGRKVTDIKRILITHAHRAHLGGVAKIKALSGAPVYAHEQEADIIRGDRKQQCNTLKPMRPYHLYFAQIGSRVGKAAPGVHVDGHLKDGDQIGPIQVVGTPGHTPGHLAFHWRAGRAFFASDMLVNYPEFGPAWPFFILNFQQNNESMVKSSKLDFDILGVGHGDPIKEGGADRLRDLVKTLGLVS